MCYCSYASATRVAPGVVTNGYSLGQLLAVVPQSLRHLWLGWSSDVPNDVNGPGSVRCAIARAQVQHAL